VLQTNYTEIAQNATKDAWQFNGADLDEQVESMVVVVGMVSFGALAIHLMLLLGWWLLHAWRLNRHVPKSLVFPVFEHTLAGIVVQPMALATAVVLLQPCALPSVRVAAAVSMAGCWCTRRPSSWCFWHWSSGDMSWACSTYMRTTGVCLADVPLVGMWP
jgi:hypothetical protein